MNGLTPRYLYHRENLNDHLEPTPGIVCGVLSTLVSSPSRPHNAPLTASGDRARTYTTSIQPAQRGRKEGEPSHPRVQEECVTLVPRRSDSNKQQHDTTPRVGCKSVKELESLASLFTHSFIAMESTHFSQKCHDTDRQAPPGLRHSGATRIRLASKKFTPLLPNSKKKKGQ
jgi:hypothetical protein